MNLRSWRAIRLPPRIEAFFSITTVVAIALALSYYQNVSLWMWFWFVVWAALWGWFVHSKRNNLDKGLIFLITSVAIAVLLNLLVKDTNPDLKEIFFQIMVLVGSGVGGNFMAHDLLTQQASDIHKKDGPRRLKRKPPRSHARRV